MVRRHSLFLWAFVLLGFCCVMVQSWIFALLSPFLIELITDADVVLLNLLHMAVKGQILVVVEELIKTDPSTINMVDNKGNTTLHIATREGRTQIIKLILGQSETDGMAINKSGKTTLDTTEKTGNSEVKSILREHGIQSGKSITKSQPKTAAREFKQTVSDIKHEFHHQLEHTCQTRKSVQGIAKRLNNTIGLKKEVDDVATIFTYQLTLSLPASMSPAMA
ncbi:ankyrin repeat-containing protein At5g02620-like [Vicia villosa]|uniref:ankyrin repeat-containing protein At5g02620-like n=1 Tax=Vicia villosa TaxID=3911 RepID=UPI00273B4EA1|nr:ankyrin repeat-containing protein At5g02620-like [Vicia villosa]